MRKTLLLCLSFLSLCAYSQQRGDDSTASCIPNWRKGDNRTLSITHSKIQKNKQGGASRPFEFAYKADITVLDQTDSDYTLQWVFHLPDEFKRKNPQLADSMPVYEGLKMIYHTSSSGIFKDLVNWVEVRDAYIKMMMMSVKQPQNDTTKAYLNQVLAMFNNRATVEGTLLQEVQLYHVPYGHHFSTRVTATPGQISLPWMASPVPTVQNWNITGFHQADHSYTLYGEEALNKVSTKALLEGLLKKIPMAADSIDNIITQIPPEFTMRNESRYGIPTDGGWISFVNFSKTVDVGPGHNEDNFLIILLDK